MRFLVCLDSEENVRRIFRSEGDAISFARKLKHDERNRIVLVFCHSIERVSFDAEEKKAVGVR
jgi:hypothetical protein